jgi:mannose-6-phosphate isomerase
MDALAALGRRAREARQWLMEACFPLWAEAGVGPDGAFLEHLDIKGRAVDALPGRVRVQARQVYVFACARRMGWDAGRARELMELGLGVLHARCRTEDGLYGRRIGPDGGGLISPEADLYDTAFALFALTHAELAGVNAEEAGQRARALMGAIRTRLRDPHGGYAEALPRPPYRLQNPHMHLLEACLARAPIDDGADLREMTEGLVSLFHRFFFDARTGTLGESFGPEWLRLTGDRDDVVEPGHHYEWVWLLGQYAQLTGTALPEAARALHRFAEGTCDAQGRACMSVRRSGVKVDPSRRTWVATEALKAHLTLARHGDDGALARAVASFDQLMDEHLTAEGGWHDHLAAEGHSLSDRMPASTGYHVVLALEALFDFVARA